MHKTRYEQHCCTCACPANITALLLPKEVQDTTAATAPPNSPGMPCRLCTPQVSLKPMRDSKTGVKYLSANHISTSCCNVFELLTNAMQVAHHAGGFQGNVGCQDRCQVLINKSNITHAAGVELQSMLLLGISKPLPQPCPPSPPVLWSSVSTELRHCEQIKHPSLLSCFASSAARQVMLAIDIAIDRCVRETNTFVHSR